MTTISPPLSLFVIVTSGVDLRAMIALRSVEVVLRFVLATLCLRISRCRSVWNLEWLSRSLCVFVVVLYVGCGSLRGTRRQGKQVCSYVSLCSAIACGMRGWQFVPVVHV